MSTLAAATESGFTTAFFFLDPPADLDEPPLARDLVDFAVSFIVHSLGGAWAPFLFAAVWPMTSTLMKVLAYPLSMTKVFWIAAVLAAPIAAGAAESRAGEASARSSAYPTFCAIPPVPTGVRDAAAFKLAVVDVRQAGRRVVMQSAPDTFGLAPGQAADFGAEAGAEAAWPLSADPERPVDSEAYAAEARRKATPPPRPHR